MTRLFPKPVVFVFVSALAIRCFLILNASVDALVGGDTNQYLGPARTLLKQGKFLTLENSNEYMFLRTPGYPTLLAGAIWLVGDDVRRLALVQAALSSLMVLAVFLFAERLTNRRIALLVAALVALDPLLIFSSGQLMTESAHAASLLILGATIVSLLYNPIDRFRNWFFSGLAMTFATLIRPTTYYLPIPLAVFGVWLLRRSKVSLWRQILCLGLGLMPLILIIGGWQVRNSVRVDTFQYSGIEAVNIYYYRGGGTISEREGRPFVEVLRDLEMNYPPRRWDQSQGDYFQQMLEDGRELIAADLASFGVMTLKAFPRLLFGESGMFLEYAGIPRNGATVWSLRLFNMMVWLIWIMTLMAGFLLPKWRRAVVGLAIPTAYVILISAGAEAYSRFRAPVMPLVYLMCGVGIAIVTELARVFRKDVVETDRFKA